MFLFIVEKNAKGMLWMYIPKKTGNCGYNIWKWWAEGIRYSYCTNE